MSLQSHLDARLTELERERDEWKARAEKAEEWIQDVDHVVDCAAADRTSSRECDCGRTAVLKRTRSR